MFGRDYHHWDQMLSQSNPLMTRNDYAQHLLAELLTRARPLSALYTRAFELAPGEGEKQSMDYITALEDLAKAIGIFLDDVEEAEVRGRRARVVSAGGLGWLGSGEGGIEPEERLAKIGGALVPEGYDRLDEHPEPADPVADGPLDRARRALERENGMRDHKDLVAARVLLDELPGDVKLAMKAHALVSRVTVGDITQAGLCDEDLAIAITEINNWLQTQGYPFGMMNGRWERGVPEEVAHA